jgi:hypothetical protein
MPAWSEPGWNVPIPNSRDFSVLPDEECRDEHTNYDEDHGNKSPFHPLIDSPIGDPANPLCLIPRDTVGSGYP